MSKFGCLKLWILGGVPKKVCAEKRTETSFPKPGTLNPTRRLGIGSLWRPHWPLHQVLDVTDVRFVHVGQRLPPEHPRHLGGLLGYRLGHWESWNPVVVNQKWRLPPMQPSIMFRSMPTTLPYRSSFLSTPENSCSRGLRNCRSGAPEHIGKRTRDARSDGPLWALK